MPRKKPKTLTFGLDKKICDDAGNILDSLELERDTKLEFLIEFTGPAFSLWLVDRGVYSPIFVSSEDGIGPGRKTLGLAAGSYTFDCSLMWVTSLNVRILM